MSRPTPVLVLCTGNSARSQIAEALLAWRGQGRIEASSAGSRPASRVNPYAVEVLAAHGVEWREHPPRGIGDLAGERFDLVITVCDDARDACPYFPGAGAQVHWGLPDPALESEPEAARRAFAATYTALVCRVERLLDLPLETMSPAAVAERSEAIHRDASATTST